MNEIYETVVRDPFLADGQDRHDRAYQILQALDVPGAALATERRPFLFELEPTEDGEALWYLRTPCPMRGARVMSLPQSGRSYVLTAQFSLDSSRSWVDQDGHKQKQQRFWGPESASRYFRGRLSEYGVEAEDLAVGFQPCVRITRPNGKGFSAIHITAEGPVSVQDTQGAARLLREGIGRCRSFGFGVVHFRPAGDL